MVRQPQTPTGSVTRLGQRCSSLLGRRLRYSGRIKTLPRQGDVGGHSTGGGVTQVRGRVIHGRSGPRARHCLKSTTTAASAMALSAKRQQTSVQILVQLGSLVFADGVPF